MIDKKAAFVSPFLVVFSKIFFAGENRLNARPPGQAIHADRLRYSLMENI